MQLDKSTLPNGNSPVNFHFIEPVSESDQAGGGRGRFNPEPVRVEDISSLVGELSVYEQRLAVYQFGYLRVSVDCEEVAIFSPHLAECEPLKVPNTASFVEVIGEDYDGVLSLAVFRLTHLDPCRRLDAHRMSVPCGEGQLLSLVISSVDEEDDDDLACWLVRLECSFVTPQTSSAILCREPSVHILDAFDELEETVQPGRALLQPRSNPLAKIVVVGIGSSGSNTVDKMIEAGIQGVTFATLNTDLQALRRSYAPTKVQLGAKITFGLGGGSDPEVGRVAAFENTEEIAEVLEGADMVFITTGMGGGTGTGAAPVVASLAKELGALTVAVVTTPFLFEGQRRMRQAELGLRLLCDRADTIITLPNERLLYTLPKNVSLRQAFSATDDVLRQAVQSILDLVAAPGLINLDFADVRTIMTGMGTAFWGVGCASGEMRALEATQQALISPLLEDATIQGAKGVLINIVGSPDLTLYEVNEAASIIREAAEDDANIIFGAVIDESLCDEMKITVIATGSRSHS